MTWANVALRRAMELNRPIIYLYGGTTGVYEPILPVYVTADDPSTLTFRLQADRPLGVASPINELVYMTAPRREYQTVAVKRRLHVREDILHEVDGPMLDFGLKGMAGRRILVPRKSENKPNPHFLDDRYQKFLAA